MRNRHIKKVLAMVCILSCINVSTSYANMVENYNFKNITIEDGLSQSTVETIYQDSKGYIWIGTNDGRERPSHVMCNNTYANPRTGKFLNGLRFPADPNGEPSEIWNCRCTLVEEVVKDEEL